MTGGLQLFRDPVDSDSSLTAATKNYVDANTYWSSNNIFVTAKGNDYQPTTPSYKRGRFLPYAFASINKAAQYAEQLIATSQIEIGDYQRLITYNNGTAATVISYTDDYLNTGLTRLILNCGTLGSDQFGAQQPGNYSIYPGQYLQGVESGAIGLIEGIARGSNGQEIYTISYVDYAINFNTSILSSIPNEANLNQVKFTFLSTNLVPIPDFWVGYQFFTDTGIGNGTIIEVGQDLVNGQYYDYFAVEWTSNPAGNGVTISPTQWHVYAADFVSNENIIYNTNVSNLQITIVVESGEYSEQYPIKLPANVSIRGDEFRRTIIRPAKGISGSPWANTYFRRDTQIDGLLITQLNTSTNYAPSVTLTPSGTSGIVDMVIGSGTISNNYVGYVLLANGGSGVITAIQNNVITVDVGTDLTSSTQVSSGSWFIYQPINFGYHYLRDSSRPQNNLTTVTNWGGLANTAALLKENKLFIQSEVNAWIHNNINTASTGSIWHGFGTYYTPTEQSFCVRDVGLIIDSVANDLIYGGSTRTVYAGDSYSNVAQVNNYELAQTVAAVGYINTIGQQIINNQTVTPTVGNTATQIISTVTIAEADGPVIVADLLQALGGIIGGNPDYNPALPNGLMDVFLMNDANVIRYVSCQNHGGFMQVLDPAGQIKNKSPYTQTASSFSQSVNKKAFRGGLFVDGFAGNVIAYPTTQILSTPTQIPVKGLMRRLQVPTFFHVAGVRYEIDFISDYAPDTQNTGTFVATLNLNPNNPGGIPNTVTVSDGVGGFVPNSASIPITIDPPTAIGGQTASGFAVSNNSGRIVAIDITFPGSGYITTPNITVGGAIINNLTISSGSVTGFNIAYGGQGYTVGTHIYIYPVNAAGVTTATAVVSSVNSVGGITGYSISAGGTNWTSSISYRTVFNSPVITVPTPVSGFIGNVPNSLELQTAGNRSMLGNDFTQVNDLGYGVFVTNGGFMENVSMFSYYCDTSYYSLNGAQVRSTTGSSCYGNRGLVAEGSDPNEVPTPFVTAYNMIENVVVYAPGGAYTANAGATSIYVYTVSGFPPFSGCQIDINHYGIIKTYTVGSSSSVLDSNNNPILINGNPLYKLAFSTGNVSASAGSQLGLTLAVPDATPAIIRSENTIKLLGFNPATFSRPTTALVYNDDPEFVYHVTNYSSIQPDNSIITTTLENYNYISFTAQEQGLTYPKITNTGTGYSTATITINTSSISTGISHGVTSIQATGTQVLSLTSVSGITLGQVVTCAASNTIATGTVVTYVSTLTNQIGISVPTYNTISSSNNLTFTSALPTTQIYFSNGHISNVLINEGGTGWTTTSTTISISGNGVSANITSPINIAGVVGSKTIKVSPLSVALEARLTSGLTSSPVYYYQIGWGSQVLNITAYRNTSVTGQSWAEIDVDQPLATPMQQGAVLNAGVPGNSAGAITVKMSLLRASGHDFVDIGTGGYATTRIPNDLYGPPLNNPQQSQEVIELGTARVFYVSTDQDGNFKVGSAFLVDQSNGTVTISAPIDLTNIDALSLKRDLGPPVNEFSTDNTMAAVADYKVPTEQAVVNYVNRRLGIDQNGSIYAGSPVGPQFLALSGQLAMKGDLNMGSGVTNRIVNLDSPKPNYPYDAANKGYADSKISLAGTSSMESDGVTRRSAWGLMTGPLQLSQDPVVVTTTVVSTGSSSSLILNVSSTTGITEYMQVNGTNIPIGAVITQVNFTTNSIQLNVYPTANIPVGEILTINPVAQAVTKRYVDTANQISQMADVALNNPADKDFLMFDATYLNTSTNTVPPVYNATRQVTNVSVASNSDIAFARTNNTLTVTIVANTITNTQINSNAAIAYSKLNLSGSIVNSDVSTSAAVAYSKLNLSGSIVNSDVSTSAAIAYSKLNLSGSIVNSDVSSSAAIAQSKLSMQAATTSTTAPVSPTQSSLGLSVFDSSYFATTNGWVTFNIANNILPTITNNYNLGSAGYKFATVYATTFNGSGSGLTNIPASQLTGSIPGTVLGSATIYIGTTAVALNRASASLALTGVSIDGSAGSVSASNLTSGTIPSSILGNSSLYIGTTAVPLNAGSGSISSLAVNISGTASYATNPGSGGSFITSNNIASQSVNYATSAGSAGSATTAGTAGNLNSAYGSGYVYGSWTLQSGATFNATYADLAEYYTADAEYEPGTVLVFGGDAEVTTTSELYDSRVAGVVTTNPAYVMNAECEGTRSCVALQGRIPVKVTGIIKKGDMLATSNKPGYATKAFNPQVGTIIGKALENKDTVGEGVIEVAIGRH